MDEKKTMGFATGFPVAEKKTFEKRLIVGASSVVSSENDEVEACFRAARAENLRKFLNDFPNGEVVDGQAKFED